ncbi:MAG: DUF998 domain-containing protein [Dehalococcoidales bacterium]
MLKLRAKRAAMIRMAGVCGILSQIAGFIVLLAVTSHSPWFSWTENHLSVLGVRGSASPLFNYGLVIVGILSLMFVIGLGKSILSGKRLGRVSTASLALGSCAIGAMGIFPRTIDMPHNCAALLFFICVPLALFLIGMAIMTSSEKWPGLLTLIAGSLMVVVYLVPWPWSGGAIPQTLSYVPWSLWSIVFGTRLLIRPG